MKDVFSKVNLHKGTTLDYIEIHSHHPLPTTIEKTQNNKMPVLFMADHCKSDGLTDNTGFIPDENGINPSRPF
jgi:hypothetical protein